MKFDLTLLFIALFIWEQFIMIRLGSYPYILGIPFARRPLPDNFQIEDVEGFLWRLKLMKDQEGNIYFRYKHLPLSWGPYVFVGQAKKEKPNELIIRLGPLSCLFFVSFIIKGLIQGFLATISALSIVVLILWLFFYSFHKGYEKVLKRTISI